MGDGDLGTSGDSPRCRDPRDDFERDARGAERVGLRGGSVEHHRVPRLESNHDPPLAGGLDHPGDDFLLGHRSLVGPAAEADELR